MLRLLPDSPTEAFDVWQVSNKDHKPETGVTVDRERRRRPSEPLCFGLVSVDMIQ